MSPSMMSRPEEAAEGNKETRREQAGARSRRDPAARLRHHRRARPRTVGRPLLGDRPVEHQVGHRAGEEALDVGPAGQRLAAAGIVSVVSGQIASWDAAVFRSDSITPQVASYAYDLGNISFANSWVATGAVGICAGLVMLRAPGLPRWAAWWAAG